MPEALNLSREETGLLAVALDQMAHDTSSFLMSTRRGSSAAVEAERVLRRIRDLRARLPVPPTAF